MAEIEQPVGGLDANDVLLRKFKEKGWVGPFPLLGHCECDKLIEMAHALADKYVPPAAIAAEGGSFKFGARKWFKSLHEVHPNFHGLASHPAIVQVVTRLLGPDVLVWGVSIKRVAAGTGHRWHVDVEQTRCEGVTVFLGLRNVDRQSTLKVLSGSHRIPASPQELKLKSDDDVLDQVRKHTHDCSIDVVDPGDGGFFVLHGRLWHGSKNVSSRDRHAMILQYCTPDRLVRIPLTFDEPIAWSDQLPGCALVAGHDRFHINRLFTHEAPALTVAEGMK